MEKQYTHANLDVETLSLSASGVVLSIGLCVYSINQVDAFDDLVRKNCLHLCLDQGVQMQAGRTVSSSTLEWWHREEHVEAYKALSSDNPLLPSHARLAILDFFESLGVDPKALKWYCKGPTFDFDFVGDYFSTFDLKPVWDYRKTRCVRTFLDDYGGIQDAKFPRPEGMVPHRADHDAAADAYAMQRVFNLKDIQDRELLDSIISYRAAQVRFLENTISQ